ncbi:hypothetical protein J4204_03845, partial [Candidatus Woesearchaeota archaeon]|nr:hypothetical protein [Candidatus Woesearchaeota archaeon]
MTSGLSAVNNTNITASGGTNFVGLNFTTLTGAVGLSSITYVSSCNTSAIVTISGNSSYSGNSTTIYPFNTTTCQTSSSNVTLKVTVTDTAGNTNSTVFGFVLDNVAPTIAVHTPLNNQRFTSITDINVSAFDSESQVDMITFTQTGVLNFSDLVNVSLSVYLTNTMTYPSNATLRLKSASTGSYESLGVDNVTNIDNTYEIFLYLNSSSANTQINVTITDINGSGANWDEINFSVLINDSVNFESHVANNFTVNLLAFVAFNGSFEKFLPNANDYFGVVLLPFNISGPAATAREI